MTKRVSLLYLLSLIVVCTFILTSCTPTSKYAGPPRPEYEPMKYVFGNYVVVARKNPPEVQTNNLACFFLTSGRDILARVYLHKDQSADVKGFAEFEKMNLPEKRAFIRRIFVEKANIDIGS